MAIPINIIAVIIAKKIRMLAQVGMFFFVVVSITLINLGYKK
jgi:hypothetical protein